MAIQELLQSMLTANPYMQYLLFAGIILVTFLGAKLLYFVFSKIFRLLASKTKTQLDDILIHALQGPVVFLFLVFGFQFATQFLTLNEQATLIFKDITTILIVINIAWFATRIINGLLQNYIEPLGSKSKRAKKRVSTVYPLFKKIVNFVVWSIAIVVGLQQIGVQITGLIAGLGIGGLAFALAAQDILANFFGGAAVLTDRPFEVGDRIKVSGQDGFVQKIGLRSTVMETFDGTNIVMPNKIIADSVLENVSREKMRRIKTILGLEYNTPTKKLEKAKKILADIVKKNKHTNDDSLVHFVEFADSSLNLQLIYWIADLDNILLAKDEINFEIKKQFEKEGLEFAYPSQTVYVKK